MVALQLSSRRDLDSASDRLALAQVAFLVVGRAGFRVVATLVVLAQAGVCVAYLIYIQTNLSLLTGLAREGLSCGFLIITSMGDLDNLWREIDAFRPGRIESSSRRGMNRS